MKQSKTLLFLRVLFVNFLFASLRVFFYPGLEYTKAGTTLLLNSQVTVRSGLLVCLFASVWSFFLHFLCYVDCYVYES